ncbi:MAG: hypothetical protein ACREJC_08915 [Tepidisphaeraceae bacterium]
MLTRPPDQRQREFRYRFAQAVVFGLPVLGLQWFGPRLGGPESGRWIAGLQVLLSGWIMYVAAAGMLFEGVILLRHRRLTCDFLVAIVALVLWAISLLRSLGILLTTQSTHRPLWFHWSVVLLATWCGWRWHEQWRRSTAVDRHVSSRP